MARFAYDFEKSVVEMESKLDEFKRAKSAGKAEIAREIEYLERQIEKLKERVYSELNPWQKVQLARHPERPRTLDYINMILSDFTELRGDRLFSDDPAVVGGFAYLDHEKIAVLGEQKGRNTKENVVRNFGMPHPEGYRKALRIMKLAEKFSLSIITFIDTPGAYPGIGAEERGQAVAIANNLMEMSKLEVPIVVVNIGEGGSGGALALGIGDKILMLENSYYSVITPEGCASILWRDETQAPLAASALQLTADRLLKLEIIDEVVKEPLGGAHRDPDSVIYKLRKVLIKSIKELKSNSTEEILDNRYKRLRKIGEYNSETVGEIKKITMPKRNQEKNKKSTGKD